MTSQPLIGYEDWPRFARAAGLMTATSDRAQKLVELLGVSDPGDHSPKVSVDSVHVEDGVRRRHLSWSTGFGPRTRAVFDTPASADGPLPGVLAMHCHGGEKWLGGEQLTGGRPSSTAALRMRDAYYGGRWPSADLARRGFAVLTHDTFAWGSRRFGFDPLPVSVAGPMQAYEALWRERGEVPSEPERYNVIAGLHEQVVAKAAGVLGSSFAGTVARDDLVALRVLLELPDVDPAAIGTYGFSGGGGRAVLLAALDDRVSSTVVACMMATFESLMPAYLETHSWLLNSPGLWKHFEWPEVMGDLLGRSLLVLFGEKDSLFPPAGMREAHEQLSALVRGRYEGRFFDAPHVFDEPMQLLAWEFLESTIGRPFDR